MPKIAPIEIIAKRTLIFYLKTYKYYDHPQSGINTSESNIKEVGFIVLNFAN